MGNQASQLGDEPAFTGQRDLAHFDHYFKGAIHTTDGPFFVKTFGEAKFADRPMNMTCKGEGFSLAEDIGIQATKQLDCSYFWVTAIAWDHAASEVKITVQVNDQDSFIILTMANSIELEQELKLRFSHMHSLNHNMKVPYPMYIGMFAGNTKPKPFQRKRPNLSRLPAGKLPGLQDMRSMAHAQQRGPAKPCAQGESRRVQIAMQHIHEGCNTFILLDARNLPSGVRSPSSSAVVQLTDDALIYKASGRNSIGNDVLNIPYEDIIDWQAIGMNLDHIDPRQSGIELTTASINKLYLGVTFVRDVSKSLEYFWNRWRTANGREVKIASTHGRPIVTVTTLSGEMPPPEKPIGSADVVDQDGIVVRPGARMVARRRSVLDQVIAGQQEVAKVPPENREVRPFWHNVVVHQGWLLKKGGIGIGENKQWIKRYFVLYTTSQGHYLIYYTDFTECPLFTNDRNPRNVVDLAKTTFIRPGSNKAEFADTPPFSFDIVTTEREWTLCAESQDNFQKWMKLLTRAVDEDVAVLPDEELVFKVKPKMDPLSVLNPNDYSTSLKVSANGISVTSPSPANGRLGGEVADHEHYFWAYTDFYKWSLLSQHGKLALLLNVFVDQSFSRRYEYIFRNKEAVRLATAIEFFIEKFMTVMHLQMEKNATAADYKVEKDTQESAARGLGASAAAEEWQEDEINLEQQQEIDLLGMDEPTANSGSPAAVNNSSPPSKGASSDDFFQDDPFGSDPFGNSSVPVQKEKIAPPLSPAQITQHQIWLKNALTNSGGPLYDDTLLQIATKVEVKASQARVTLYYRNKGPSQITNLTVTLLDPAGLLRFELSALAPTLDAMSQAQNILMVECMKPAAPGPSIQITYVDSVAGKRDNTLAFPLNTATFNEPLSLAGADFSGKWNQLTAQGQQKQEVFHPSTPISPANVLLGMTKALKFGKVTNMPDESEFVIYGASSLKTGAIGPNSEKISVGCLVKIEMNVQSNAIRLTARTLHPAATLAIFECARALLG